MAPTAYRARRGDNDPAAPCRCAARRQDDEDLLLEAAIDGVWRWDLEHFKQGRMSPEFWRMLGYAPDATPRRPGAWRSIADPDDLAVAVANFKKHCADPVHPFDEIVRFTHVQGHAVWIRCRGLAIRNDRGAATHMAAALTNVTAFKENERDLIEQNAKLTQREEQLEFRIQGLKNFASVVAHDLNAPLRQTSMFLGMLEAELGSESPLSAPSQSAIDGLNSVLDRMRRIVKSLYELFKVGAFDLESQPTPLAGVIADAIALSQEYLDARNVRVEIGETPTMRIDPDLISQVVQNILINACKYNDADRMTIRISSERDVDNKKMTVFVDDNGSGVPKGAEEKIFEPYKRIGDTGGVEGAGIGLALCRRIMSLHRGSIYVDPNFPDGARFVLSFPDSGNP